MALWNHMYFRTVRSCRTPFKSLRDGTRSRSDFARSWRTKPLLDAVASPPLPILRGLFYLVRLPQINAVESFLERFVFIPEP